MSGRYQNLNPQKGLIWRIVHVSNTPWILDNGLYSANSTVQSPNYQAIGNPELIQKRTQRAVPIERSIAIPPLGAGNGKLNWDDVKPHIEQSLADLESVDVYVYEPTSQYHNVATRKGELKLTPARAMIAELVRQYWTLGVECSLLEVQKLAWFLERSIERHSELSNNPLDLRFEANIYGPYADRLRHVLEHLDGTYLKCEKRISDSDPLDLIWFDDAQKERLETYLKSSEMEPYNAALTETIKLIDGFETPFGLELLSTLDWLVHKEEVESNKAALMDGIRKWPAGAGAAARKSKIFHEKAVAIALNSLEPFYQVELA